MRLRLRREFDSTHSTIFIGFCNRPVTNVHRSREGAEPEGEATIDDGASFGERSEPKENRNPNRT
jgi:hypothetical protein